MVIITWAAFFFCILLLATISGIFSEKAGIVNIAINGFIVFGAIMYSLFSAIYTDVINAGPDVSQYYNGPWMNILFTALAALSTVLFSLLFGFAVIKMKSDQTISGFAINILATGIASLLVFYLTANLQKSGAQISFRERTELTLSTNNESWQNLISYKLIVTVVIAFVSWFSLMKTRWGLRFRAIGENPQAADVAGINVNKIKWQAMVILGIITGIAGSLFIEGLNKINEFSITKDVQGFGFLALAIMITSKWRVSYSILISLLFSFLLSFSFFGVNLLGETFSRYKDLLAALPYLLTLLLMIATSKNTNAPAAAGVPYDKSKR
ncbi:ABC transporter permease [Mycoplasma leonicaptivi]|uniref:ABC transporter permease n=1 Tax=Mycoplasma leonicaptivi TaxID=36742 RepID=UPI000B11C3BE